MKRVLEFNFKRRSNYRGRWIFYELPGIL